MKNTFKNIAVFMAAGLIMIVSGCAPLLHRAAGEGDVATIKRLLDEGANVNEGREGDDTTPLHWASCKCQIEAIKLLLERGADINAISLYGINSLCFASMHGCFEGAKLFVEKGSNIDEARLFLENWKLWTSKTIGKYEALKLLTNVEDRIKEEKIQANLKQQKLAEEKALANQRKDQQKIAELAAEAEKNDDYRKAFQICLDYLKEHTDSDIQKRIIQLYPRLDPKPSIPEEARKHAAFASAAAEEAAKTANEKYLDRAINEYREALKLAPWWPDIYINAALVMEQRKLYDDAAQMLSLFLLAAPNDPEAPALQDKIYKLKYKAELEAGK